MPRHDISVVVFGRYVAFASSCGHLVLLVSGIDIVVDNFFVLIDRLVASSELELLTLIVVSERLLGVRLRLNKKSLVLTA